jgi:hypothetical protein
MAASLTTASTLRPRRPSPRRMRSAASRMASRALA